MPVKLLDVYTEMGEGTEVVCKAGNHEFIIDQTVAAGGKDRGPTPLEYYLVSIAGCISSIGRIVARQKNIPLRGMKITTNGSIDTDVLLGKRNDLRPGFQEIVLAVEIDADLTPAQKEEFLREVDRRCPVSENTLNATNLKISLAGK